MTAVILLVVFAASGFTGLIYESIWSHYLKLFLGHAAYAQTLVLVIFMGGLAVGAALVSRWTERVRRPLVAYALVELLVGLLALAFDREFRAFTGWAFATVLPSMQSAGLIQSFKWTGAALLILPQSILLGMTFPLIGSGLVRAVPRRTGELLALLYFANCAGAAVGVLTSGFYLIGRFGLPGTLLFAGLINVLVALAAWLAGRASRGQLSTWRVPDLARVELRIDPRRLMLAAFVTGLASFLYEIAWIRMLSLALGSSTHSFELMLAAFIIGLAAGGLWVRRRIDHLRDPVRFLSGALLAIAALAALTVAAYYYSFDVIAWAKAAFTPTERGYVGFNLVAQTLAMAIMVPVTFVAGMTLPLITSVAMRIGGGESAVGRIYAWNTLGCIAGVVVAVHILMPSLGTKGTVLVGSLLTIGLAAVVGTAARSPEGRGLRRTGMAIATLVVAVVAIGVTTDPRRLASAVYRTGAAELPASSRVTYLRDGRTSTISLVEDSGQVTIATNGKPDAAIQMGKGPPSGDEVTMIMAAALPLAVHPSPRRVANIGIGSGLTSSVLLTSRDVESLTSIEIEPFMVEAARMGFMPRVENLFRDPRSRIVIEDAKTFFASSHRQFDVIVSEPSNPWVSGVATLFSEEFYRQLKPYLAEGGLLVQWIQTYETDIAVVISILKALSPHFADYQLYNVDDSDVLIVASVDGPVRDPRPGIFQSVRLRAELERAGFMGIEDFTSRRIANKMLLDPWLALSPTPVNSDYFPFVDLHAAKFRFMERNAGPLVELTMLPVPVAELALPDWKTLTPAPPPRFGQSRRDTMVNRAVVVARSFAVVDSSFLPPTVAGWSAMLDVAAEACASRGTRRAWLASVQGLSAQTAAMLPYAEVQPMWNRIRTSGCYTSASALQRAWPDFLEAVARRDRHDIERLGRMLLSNRLVGPRSDDAGLVLTAVAAAMLGAGHPAECREFLAMNIPTLMPTSRYSLALQILAAAATRG